MTRVEVEKECAKRGWELVVLTSRGTTYVVVGKKADSGYWKATDTVPF